MVPVICQKNSGTYLQKDPHLDILLRKYGLIRRIAKTCSQKVGNKKINCTMQS